MTVSLETLELTADQLQAARDAVRQMAYYQWEEAGRPNVEGNDFWALAEREWIERYYVPCRSFEGARTVDRKSRTASYREQPSPIEVAALQSAT